MQVRDVVTIREAFELMRCERVHRLPVVNADGAILGILTIKDVVLPADKGRGRYNEDAGAFLTLSEHATRRDTLRGPAEGVPAAFDEKGRSPLERVFSEPEDE